MDNLIFQLQGPVLESLSDIKYHCFNNGFHYGRKSNSKKAHDHGHWYRDYLKNSTILAYDHNRMPYINNHPNLKTIWDQIQLKIGNRNLLRCYINGYAFGTDSYAHTDDTWMLEEHGEKSLADTIIVYLNDTWDIDWAGETVIFNDDEEIELAVLPKFGRVLVFNSNKLHTSRPVTRYCDTLRTVLVFKTSSELALSNEVEFIASKTSNIKHNQKTLFEHLFNTAIILEKRKSSKELCIAGLFHAIYNVELKEKNIDRNDVKNLIGEYAESLVYEFSIMENRTKILLSNENNYNKSFLKDLIKIEIARLTEHRNNNYIEFISALENKIIEE